MIDCKEPKACTIVLRGASKDILNEVERNLQDALHVARNVMVDARLVPGGGAVEMALSRVSVEAILGSGVVMVALTLYSIIVLYCGHEIGVNNFLI